MLELVWTRKSVYVQGMYARANKSIDMQGRSLDRDTQPFGYDLLLRTPLDAIHGPWDLD